MGQKVNPIGFRLGIYRDWPSRWFARRNNYASMLFEDIKIRNFIKNRLPDAEIAEVNIEKVGEDNVRVVLVSARPGVVIGKKGQEIDALRKSLAKLLNRKNVDVSVQEIKNPDLNATILAQGIADQLENRGSFKKAMKKAAQLAIKAGARGIKIRCAGRLGGAEIARDEWLRIGSTPLHTLRADIDYALAEAQTTYGIIGIKVWVCLGEYQVQANKKEQRD